MKVQILSNAEDISTQFSALFKWADHVDLAYAWATCEGEQAVHWRSIDFGKIRRAVIGTQFAQTEPCALRVLNEKPGTLRVAIGNSGTFHPKCIIGYKGRQTRAIVGSANLTKAAFTKNVELNILLEGAGSDGAFEELSDFIEQQWDAASELSEKWLREYEILWATRPLDRIVVPQAKLKISSIRSLQMPWSEYYRVISGQEGRKLASGDKLSVVGAYPSYMVELERIEALFNRENSFERMDYADRQLVIGIGPASSGLIGTMQAAGFAKGVVRTEPEVIGKFLDRIPLRGPVPLADVGIALEGMTQIKGVKVGVASRLLAVKRPDLFVSVNNGSNPALSVLLSRSSITKVDEYLDLLRTVWDSEWHQSPEPTDPLEKRVWIRRAALLDAALYEQVVQRH